MIDYRFIQLDRGDQTVAFARDGVRIQVEFALLLQLHHRRPGQELGDGGNPKQGFLRIHATPRFDVADPVAFFEQYLTIGDHTDYRAGHMMVAQGGCHEAVGEGFQVGAIAGVGRR